MVNTDTSDHKAMGVIVRYYFPTFLFILSNFALAAVAEESEQYYGRWLTPEERSVIEIGPCLENPDRLCGTIIWTDPSGWENGKPPIDDSNPDPDLRSRPLKGLQLLKSFKWSGKRWKGGEIYNPDDGKTYNSKLKLEDDIVLKVSGCVLFFCRTQLWVSAEGFDGQGYRETIAR